MCARRAEGTASTHTKTKTHSMDGQKKCTQTMSKLKGSHHIASKCNNCPEPFPIHRCVLVAARAFFPFSVHSSSACRSSGGNVAVMHVTEITLRCIRDTRQVTFVPFYRLPHRFRARALASIHESSVVLGHYSVISRSIRHGNQTSVIRWRNGNCGTLAMRP